MSKQFLAVGDYLINPELLTHAVLEQGAAEPRLRLGFATRGADKHGELHLTGDVARELLRWLRLNANFLSTGGAFGSSGVPIRPPHETESRSIARTGNGVIGEGWGLRSIPHPEDSGRFLSRA
jgi:hypothetical protein